MKSLALLGALLCAVALAAAHPAAAQVALNETPAVISGGVGWYDVIDQNDEAVDFRLEYRHDKGLLFLKPWGGIEATTDGSVWGGVGVLMDLTFFDRVVLTGSFAPGLWSKGDGKDLDSTVEFRSQIELGYQFDNKSRLSLGLSHTSNAGIGDHNPGVEVLSVYYHLPLNSLF